MRKFSFRKPLSRKKSDGTFVIRDLAQNHRFTTISVPLLGTVLVYADALYPDVKVYFTLDGKFIVLERKMESRSEVPDENGHWTKTVFIQWYLPNGDSCELRKTSLCDKTSRLIERCVVVQAGRKTCTLKDVQENGRWQKADNLPCTALQSWMKELRYYAKR